MQRGSAPVLILVGVLIISLVAGGVYYFGKAKVIKPIPIEQDVSASEESPKDVSQSNPLLSSNPRNNPTLYTNSNLGVKLNLLDGLKIVEDSEEEYNKRGNGNYRKNFKGYVSYEPPQFVAAIAVLDKTNDFDKNPFTVWVFNNDNNLTIDAWFKDYWYYPFLWGVFDFTSKGHITPDTEATISGSLTKYKIVSYQPGSPKYLYLSNNGKMYLLRIIGETGEEILSTLNLTK
ncbi:hypothetical protein HYU95_05100 [Candidatus Daviesbacteria bacterium]|nr:hypothetical protein [Candidatus Daviesbacteria bacterium]